MCRSSSLSDPEIIRRLNERFVPVQVNMATEGVSAAAPGLKLWQDVYRSHWKYRFGYATSVVLDPDGNQVYGASGWGHWWEYGSCPNFSPKLYARFLEESRDRFLRVEKIRDDEGLTAPERTAALARVQDETREAIRKTYTVKKKRPRGEERRKRNPEFGRSG